MAVNSKGQDRSSEEGVDDKSNLSLSDSVEAHCRKLCYESQILLKHSRQPEPLS